MKRTLAIILLVAIGLGGCDKQPKPTAPAEPPQHPAKETLNKTQESAEKPVIESEPATLPVINKKTSPSPSAPATTGRIWTSTDGRTVTAVMLSRTPDTITIQRNEDHQEFTIPLQNLSAEDQDYVQKSDIAITVVKPFDTQKLEKLKQSLPAIRPQAPLPQDYSQLVSFYKKYQDKIEFISEVGFDRHFQMLQLEMESDLKRLQLIAGTQVSHAPKYSEISGNWSRGKGAWKEVWFARSAVTWLQGPFKRYVDELEQLKQK